MGGKAGKSIPGRRVSQLRDGCQVKGKRRLGRDKAGEVSGLCLRDSENLPEHLDFSLRAKENPK